MKANTSRHFSSPSLTMLAFIAILCLFILSNTAHGLSCAPLCPDGSPVPNPNAVFIEADFGAQYTCGDVDTNGAWVGFVEDLLSIQINSDYICPVMRYTAVQKCGCADTLPPFPEKTSCPLCEDGSFPPDPSLEVFPSFTCHQLAYGFLTQGVSGAYNPLVGVLTEYGNQTKFCTAMQATGGVYCGCSNPIVSQGACRICGDQLLPEPARVLQLENSAKTTSCDDLEFAANNGKQNFTCSDFQTGFNLSCCSKVLTSPSGPTSTPILAPTGSTRTPTLAPTKAPNTSDASTFDMIFTNIFFMGIIVVLIL